MGHSNQLQFVSMLLNYKKNIYLYNEITYLYYIQCVRLYKFNKYLQIKPNQTHSNSFILSLVCSSAIGAWLLNEIQTEATVVNVCRSLYRIRVECQSKWLYTTCNNGNHEILFFLGTIECTPYLLQFSPSC